MFYLCLFHIYIYIYLEYNHTCYLYIIYLIINRFIVQFDNIYSILIITTIFLYGQ